MDDWLNELLRPLRDHPLVVELREDLARALAADPAAAGVEPAVHWREDAGEEAGPAC